MGYTKRTASTSEEPFNPKWADLLTEAVNRPGVISTAFRAFHNYSVGNQIAAAYQIKAKGFPIQPIATYAGWQKKGRQVRGGEHSFIWLCVHNTFKKENEKTGEEEVKAYFKWKKGWFALAQTDGPDASEQTAAIPGWDRDCALKALGVTMEVFQDINGNCLGYAHHKTVAVSPLSDHPEKTLFHELGHVQLGHTEELLIDGPQTPRSLREVEAECVALICSESLGLPGGEFSRGYIQNWLGDKREIPEASARRIFSAADDILKAGVEQKCEKPAEQLAQAA